MIITLTGSNSFALKQRQDELVDEFVKKNGELSLTRIDAEEANTQSLIEAVQGNSLLSDYKLVVVRDLSLNKSAQADIEQIISSVDENCTLIFVEPAIDRRSSYFKVLKNHTQLEDFKENDPASLAKWLVNEAKKQDAELSYADANYLIERAGDNQSLLNSELAKLITYEPKISRENIELLVVKNPQSKIFDLLDAAFKGNKAGALRLYAEQRTQRIEPQEVLNLIAWQLRLITVMKLAQGRNVGEVSADLGISTFPLGKAGDLARNLSSQELTALVDEAYRIDKLAKSKPIDLDEALKTYLTTI